MPPIRRYLRITKYSVLECRIYLDNPADGPRWLLNPRDPALPRIVKSVKPLVLPKLREERERAKQKGRKVKSVKDTVVEDDFEVSIYLTEISASHSLLTKNKTFNDRSSKASQAAQNNTTESAVVIREDSDEEHMDLSSIPVADDTFRGTATLDVDSDSSDGSAQMDSNHASSKKAKLQGDDKKKLAMNTTYEGFSIYGRILCLVVTRKGVKATVPLANQDAHGQEMMKDWIMSTQAPKQVDIE